MRLARCISPTSCRSRTTRSASLRSMTVRSRSTRRILRRSSGRPSTCSSSSSSTRRPRPLPRMLRRLPSGWRSTTFLLLASITAIRACRFRTSGNYWQQTQSRSERRDHRMSDLQLRQIQGFILRMYRMPMVRHFLLRVNTPAAARGLLGRLVSGDERDTPQITTAEEWHVAAPGPEDDRKAPPRRQTDYCLNVGVTWSGLVALEVKDRLPGFSHGTFNAFVEGAAKRAEALGDRGPSGPEHWVSGFGTGNDHVLITLYALHPEAMERYSTRLTALFAEAKAYELLARIDGMDLFETQAGKPLPVPHVHCSQ